MMLKKFVDYIEEDVVNDFLRGKVVKFVEFSPETEHTKRVLFIFYEDICLGNVTPEMFGRNGDV